MQLASFTPRCHIFCNICTCLIAMKWKYEKTLYHTIYPRSHDIQCKVIQLEQDVCNFLAVCPNSSVLLHWPLNDWIEYFFNFGMQHVWLWLELTLMLKANVSDLILYKSVKCVMWYDVVWWVWNGKKLQRGMISKINSWTWYDTKLHDLW